MQGNQVRVLCLLLVGDEAELQVTGQDEPVRWPAAEVAGQTGLAREQLPGRWLVAELAETRESGRVLSGFRLAD
jgi:hypothetical protein